MIRIPVHAPGLLEAVLQRLILGHLAKLPGCAVLAGDGKLLGDPNARAIFWRQNVALAQTPDSAIRMGVTGQADIGGVVTGRAWGIEVKRDGERQTPVQRAYQQRFERAGGRYYVARTLDQALVPVCEVLGLEFFVEGELPGVPGLPGCQRR